MDYHQVVGREPPIRTLTPSRGHWRSPGQVPGRHPGAPELVYERRILSKEPLHLAISQTEFDAVASSAVHLGGAVVTGDIPETLLQSWVRGEAKRHGLDPRDVPRCAGLSWRDTAPEVVDPLKSLGKLGFTTGMRDRKPQDALLLAELVHQLLGRSDAILPLTLAGLRDPIDGLRGLAAALSVKVELDTP